MPDFIGTALPLTSSGLGDATSLMGVTPAHVWAVLEVETRGCGFLPDRRPQILFERHVFHRQTHGQFDARAPDISNATAGGYGAGGANQYLRLELAASLAREAALNSASWGLGQVMGFNAPSLGFSGAEEMANAMANSEDDQLRTMVKHIVDGNMHRALRDNNFAEFARRYNGPHFEKNKYDVHLAGAVAKFSAGGLPDLGVRTAQVLLLFAGHNPGVIDGFMGRRTRSALNEFQNKEGIATTDNVTDDVLRRLRDRVSQLPQ